VDVATPTPGQSHGGESARGAQRQRREPGLEQEQEDCGLDSGAQQQGEEADDGEREVAWRAAEVVEGELL
jgi:hypothetical protein